MSHNLLRYRTRRKAKVGTKVDPGKYGHRFMISIPSGEVMISTHLFCIVPMYIAQRELFSNLIVLEMTDYNVILGMYFLDKYSTSIECRCR